MRARGFTREMQGCLGLSYRTLRSSLVGFPRGSDYRIYEGNVWKGS